MIFTIILHQCVSLQLSQLHVHIYRSFSMNSQGNFQFNTLAINQRKLIISSHYSQYHSESNKSPSSQRIANQELSHQNVMQYQSFNLHE